MYIYAPHEAGAEQGWPPYIDENNPRESFHAGETRLMALAVYNEGNSAEPDIRARVAFSPHGSLQPNSTCIYRSLARSGMASPGAALAQYNGLGLGSLAPRYRCLSHVRGDTIYLKRRP